MQFSRIFKDYFSISKDFKKDNLESEYLVAHLSIELKYFKYLILILGVINFSFLIPDYLNNSKTTFIVISILRTIVLLTSFYLYFKNDYIIKNNLLYKSNTIYEIIFISSFLIISYLYNSFVFTIQALWMVMLIVGVFFLIPNKLFNKLIISIITGIIFYTISFFHHETNPTYIYAVFTFTLLLIFLSTFSVFYTDKSKRFIFLQQKKYQEISIKDPLTGIYNKRKFNKELNYHIQEVKRYNSDLSLIILDIDNFKEINDMYGHLTGDNVLIKISQIINTFIRDPDIFFRIGGEEFAIILPNTKLLDAETLATRLCQSISRSSYYNINNITCSFGVGQFLKGNAMSFFDSVDEALYKAKKAGKNRVEIMV